MSTLRRGFQYRIRCGLDIYVHEIRTKPSKELRVPPCPGIQLALAHYFLFNGLACCGSLLAAFFFLSSLLVAAFFLSSLLVAAGVF